MKIKVLTNGVKDLNDVNIGLTNTKNILSSTLPIDFTIYQIDKTFTSQIVNSDVVHNGYSIPPQEILACKEVDGIDDIVLLIFDATKIYPQPTNPVTSGLTKGKTISIQMSEQWYSDMNNVFEEFLLHELCHALYFKTNTTPDLTHFKYDAMWNGKFNQLQNNDYYLYLIKQLIPLLKPSQSPTMPQNAVLTRNSDNGTETLGTLTVGNFTCKTLERPYKGNQSNISSIPVGTYQCKYTFSLRMLKYTYEVTGVSGRSGIRIHSGNFFSDSLGCILLGDSYEDIDGDNTLDILHSRDTIKKFEYLMQKKDFKLLIQ